MAKQKLKTIEEINEELDAEIQKLDREIWELSRLLTAEEYAFCKEIHVNFERECAKVVPHCVNLYGRDNSQLTAHIIQKMKRTQIKHMEIELKYLKSLNHAGN